LARPFFSVRIIVSIECSPSNGIKRFVFIVEYEEIEATSNSFVFVFLCRRSTIRTVCPITVCVFNTLLRFGLNPIGQRMSFFAYVMPGKLAVARFSGMFHGAAFICAASQPPTDNTFLLLQLSPSTFVLYNAFFLLQGLLLSN